MALVDLVMPKMGESIMEATILKWHKQPGDKVKQDETILEIATDKVDTEVPSTTEGILEEILYKIDDVVPIGSVIAKIRTSVDEGTGSSQQPVKTPEEKTRTTEPVSNNPVERPSYQPQTSYSTVATARPQTTNGTGNRFYSPLVLNIAANEGISMTELEAIHGTGNEGRVTKKDILQYVTERGQDTKTARPET